MKPFLLAAALFALPFPSKAQYIYPTVQEDVFQPSFFWDVGTKGLGNVNAGTYFLAANNVDLYVTTWDSGDPVYDNKYGGFVVRQYTHGTQVKNSSTYTYQQYKDAYDNPNDFNNNHISSLEAGFFQYSGNTYVALTYFGIASSSSTSGKFFISIYQWNPNTGLLNQVVLPQSLTASTPVPLNATDGWIHQDINDQNQIVVTWDEGGRIFTCTAELTGTTTLTISGIGILGVPMGSLSKPDVAMTLLPSGNSDIYYTFISTSDIQGNELWVYKGDYNSLSSIPSGTTQPYTVDSVYHKATTGIFGLPRIDLPNTSASAAAEVWSIVAANHHGPNDIFAASYSNGTGLKEQTLNDGSLGSLPDIAATPNNRPAVAFSPIDNQLYYAWVYQQQNQLPTYVSVKTTTGLNLLNYPSAAYFLIPFFPPYTVTSGGFPQYPAVALSTNNSFGQLFTSFMINPSASLQISLGLKTVGWGSNGYKPNPTGISEAMKQGDFSTYPNPFQTGFAIKKSKAGSTNFQVSLFNILGQEVDHTQGSLKQVNEHLKTIGQKLSIGTYFLELNENEGSVYHKEIVKTF